MSGKSVLNLPSDTSLRTKEAQVYFHAGKNCDGYFDAADLLVQTDVAIDLFEDNFPGTATGALDLTMPQATSVNIIDRPTDRLSKEK